GVLLNAMISQDSTRFILVYSSSIIFGKILADGVKEYVLPEDLRVGWTVMGDLQSAFSIKGHILRVMNLDDQSVQTYDIDPNVNANDDAIIGGSSNFVISRTAEETLRVWGMPKIATPVYFGDRGDEMVVFRMDRGVSRVLLSPRSGQSSKIW